MITIPDQSKEAFSVIDLSTYRPIQDRIDVFKQYDKEHPDGDPSNVKFLGTASGCVVWSAKLAIDADGVAYGPGRRNGKQLDPDSGQNDTSLHIEGRPLSSERHPYYVLPGGLFRTLTGLALGDLCAVVYNGCITGAVFGDIGPSAKCGEGSIFLHEGLSAGGAPDPCRHRGHDGSCELIRNASIEGDVLVIAWPQSAITLSWDNAADEIRQAVYGRLSAMREQ